MANRARSKTRKILIRRKKEKDEKRIRAAERCPIPLGWIDVALIHSDAFTKRCRH
jgi:hypothetical protein